MKRVALIVLAVVTGSMSLWSIWYIATHIGVQGRPTNAGWAVLGAIVATCALSTFGAVRVGRSKLDNDAG